MSDTTSTATPARPVPESNDHDTSLLFRGARDGVLVVAECADCDTTLHPPRGICPSCRSMNIASVPTSGRGSVYSWTVVEHRVHPSFDVPYTIVVVELDDRPGVRLIGHIDGRADVSIGTPLEVTFIEVEQGVWRPDWRISSDAS